jgi:hypothetical protein
MLHFFEQLKGQFSYTCRISATKSQLQRDDSFTTEEKSFLLATTFKLFGAETQVAEIWQVSKIWPIVYAKTSIHQAALATHPIKKVT